MLTDATRMPDGSFRFSLTDSSSPGFMVLAAGNPTSPLREWTELGNMVEVAPGRFEFTDPQAATGRQRFHGVRSH
ncbi:MAG TPA: hypothetical protein PKM73_01185 [Verrucomicrobiota bacterium]|nr:hypothetical protein [Verrucomicrobiota bacterium]HNU49997.1 hypothetical protein [Verrucomicrobiota bacterium]